MSLQAHSTVDTSAPGNPWDPTNPRFFSGTNCSATGIAAALSGYISEAHLTVGGTDVKDYYDKNFVGPIQPGSTIGTNQTSASLTVYFDSTHFADASNIPIQMSVTDTAGNKYDANVKANACNNLLALANQTSSWDDNTFNPPINVAEEAMNGTTTTNQPSPGVVQQSGPNNISGTGKDSDHKADLISDISGSTWTAFFMATHSAHGALGDCYSTPDSDPTTYLVDSEIQGAISARTKALYPPYLFVHIHGCEGGGTTTLTNDFGIASISSDDRSCVAYDQSISVDQQNTNFVVLMWKYLFAGQKVNDASYNAGMIYPLQIYQGPNTPPDNNHTTSPEIYGDTAMTLHNKVYGWVSGPTWYR